MGFGTDLLGIVAFGALLLGPKRMLAVLGHLARAKVQMEHATRNFKADLDAEVGPTSSSEPDTPCPTAVRGQ